MPDYKEMYTKLFQSQTQAIHILQEAQLATEEMYIEAEPPSLTVLPINENKNNNNNDSK